MCKELDTKGYLMFIEHITDETMNWVIFEQVKLLEDVSGSLFAPSNFHSTILCRTVLEWYPYLDSRHTMMNMIQTCL